MEPSICLSVSPPLIAILYLTRGGHWVQTAALQRGSTREFRQCRGEKTKQSNWKLHFRVIFLVYHWINFRSAQTSNTTCSDYTMKSDAGATWHFRPIWRCNIRNERKAKPSFSHKLSTLYYINSTDLMVTCQMDIVQISALLGFQIEVTKGQQWGQGKKTKILNTGCFHLF